MDSLTGTIQKYYTYFKNHCKCNPGNCLCETAATIKAYTNLVVPEEFRNTTIDDFNGIKQSKDGKKKEILLPQNIVIAARKQIIQYCWNDIAEGEDYSVISWLQRTALEQRRKEGSSLIIYGSKWIVDKNSPGRPFQKPFGRTMAAAIVMREIVKLRWRPGHLPDSYEWVNFGILINRLMAQGGGNNEFDNRLHEYIACDWLVVDEINAMERGTDAQKNFRSGLLDKIFCERREAGKPNILVFQDNIAKMEDIRYEFGNEMYAIVNSRKTHKVSLIGGEDNAT